MTSFTDTHTFTVGMVIEKDGDRWYGHSPDVKGVHVEEETTESCIRAMREALQIHMQGLLNPPEYEDDAPFSPGDVVRVKHGSAPFTVTRCSRMRDAYEDWYEVDCIGGPEYATWTFPAVALRKSD